MSNHIKFLDHVTFTSWIFFEIFTSGRHHRDHRDMKAPKILVSNSKHFAIYGIFKKWQIGVPRLTF